MCEHTVPRVFTVPSVLRRGRVLSVSTVYQDLGSLLSLLCSRRERVVSVSTIYLPCPQRPRVFAVPSVFPAWETILKSVRAINQDLGSLLSRQFSWRGRVVSVSTIYLPCPQRPIGYLLSRLFSWRGRVVSVSTISPVPRDL